MSTEEEKLHEFLREIQLEQFYYLVVRNLHVTRLSHFDHVEEIDLTGIGMSKPEQRRLFDHLKKAKRLSLKKLFRKSFRKDPEKKQVISRPKEASTSFDAGNGDQLSSANDPVIAARNNIQQGLKCLIQQKDLVLGDFLGKGAFGYVRKGVWTTDKGAQLNVAVKCLKPNHDEATVMLQGEFIKEANAMSRLDHPNLIRLYGIVLTTPMMLVTELAPVGSLLNRLRKEPHKFMISVLCSLVVQIVSGMKYLEMKRFIHRDLAARNILLVSYEKIKIGDFGLMRALPSDTDYYVMQPTGLVPFAWCATECLKYRRFSHASDVWAFGVTVLEIFSYGQEPWPGLSGAEILERIDAPNFMRPERPDHCPIEIYKIMKHHCWNHSPEQRASFEALEKMILKVLPKETNALIDYYPVQTGELPFKKGDPLTIIEASHDPSLVKAQNRRNGKVGFIPIQLLSSSGLKSPDIKVHHLSMDVSKTGKIFQSEHGKGLEPDSFSVVSRTSSSSSGSNSSSEYPPGRHSLTSVHTTPKDIPVEMKRQSTASSGIGSGGPSLTSSYKEDTMLPCVSESDYGSQDDSVSLASRKSIKTRAVVEDALPLRDYENTIIGRRSASPPDQAALSPTEHSNPIAIPRHKYEIPQIFAMPKDPNTCECPHLHIVSLPCHNSDDRQNAAVSVVPNGIEFDNTLSCSAPTTKYELNTVQCTQRKSQIDDAAVFSPELSYGRCKQRKSVKTDFYQIIDNMVYESMTGRQSYETMKEQAATHEEIDARDTYENVEISISPVNVSDSDSLAYENVALGPKSQRKGIDTPPPILPREKHCIENTVPLPARTYRELATQPSKSSGYPDKISIYENLGITSSCKAQTERLKLPPKTYKKSIGSYENTDLCLTISFSSKPCYENFEPDCNIDRGMFPVNSSCQTQTNPTAHESSCDIERNYSDGLPPPLPEKKSNRYKTERSLSLNISEGCLPSVRPVTDQRPIEQTTASSVEHLNSVANTSEGNIVESDKHNLIDDSPVHKNLPCKYGTLWDGQEISNGEGAETPDDQPASSGPQHDVPCDELVPIPSSGVSVQEGTTNGTVATGANSYVSAEDRGLLRALLSPVEGRSPFLVRAQSEDNPVPPPRKRRDRPKTSRRHTVGTLSVKQPADLVDEVTFESVIDKKCTTDVPEDLNVSDTRESLSTKPTEVAESDWQNSAGGDVFEKLSSEPDSMPSHSRIRSNFELKREDSDFVDIEVEEAQLNNGLQSTSNPPGVDISSLKEGSLPTGISSDNAGGSLEKGKSEAGKSRFSKIKSLLSGKISSVDEAIAPSAEISTRSVEGKGNSPAEEGTDLEEKEDDTVDDETRYVLHFVTPV